MLIYFSVKTVRKILMIIWFLFSFSVVIIVDTLLSWIEDTRRYIELLVDSQQISIPTWLLFEVILVFLKFLVILKLSLMIFMLCILLYSLVMGLFMGL